MNARLVSVDVGFVVIHECKVSGKFCIDAVRIVMVWMLIRWCSCHGKVTDGEIGVVNCLVCSSSKPLVKMLGSWEEYDVENKL